MTTPKLLTTRQAAEIVGLSPGTLENWRLSGVGPPWVKVGARAIRYQEAELLAWAMGSRGSGAGK